MAIPLTVINFFKNVNIHHFNPIPYSGYVKASSPSPECLEPKND